MKKKIEEDMRKLLSEEKERVEQELLNSSKNSLTQSSTTTSTTEEEVKEEVVTPRQEAQNIEPVAMEIKEIPIGDLDKSPEVLPMSEKSPQTSPRKDVETPREEVQVSPRVSPARDDVSELKIEPEEARVGTPPSSTVCRNISHLQ